MFIQSGLAIFFTILLLSYKIYCPSLALPFYINSWNVISHMITARQWPFAAVLSSNQLILEGEFTKMYKNFTDYSSDSVICTEIFIVST